MQIKSTFLITAAALFIGIAAKAESTPNSATQKSDGGAQISAANMKKAIENAKIKVTGYAQAQYINADSKDSADGPYAGFNVRRAAISVKGELDKNWSAEVGFEIDSSGKGEKTNDIFVDKAVISYKTDIGTLTAGYKKVAFVLEEYSSSKTALCIEQSIASGYINKVTGLTGRHGGVWWDGKAEDFKYGIALTNANSNDFDKQTNGLAVYANVGYTAKMDWGKTEIGVNGAYNMGDDRTASKANHGAIYGVEPFIKISSDGFTGILDGLYVSGDSDSSLEKDNAYGINATLAYRMDCDLEPVARISYLNVGDNENINASLSKNVPKDGAANYDSAIGGYIGANYYMNKYIKLSAGYEYVKLSGGPSDSGYSSAFRLQLQAAF